MRQTPKTTAARALDNRGTRGKKEAPAKTVSYSINRLDPAILKAGKEAAWLARMSFNSWVIMAIEKEAKK